MMAGAKYVLDANVFIEAARRYYAFDLVPAFWGALVHLAHNGKIESIDRVREELLRGKDALAEWVGNDFSDAFSATSDEAVIQTYREIVAWLEAQPQYLAAAKSQFAAGADGWLVAYAKQNGHKVVTHEVLNDQIKNRVPIPNVCRAFGVNFVNTFKMLRELNVKL
jgi:predicted nucleic acid-binding protein